MAAGFVLQAPEGAAYAVTRPTTIGRDPRCQIVLADARVSRQHATAWVEGGRLYLRDDNAVNGTFINGRRLAAGETVAVQPGDQIQLGSARLLAGLASGPLHAPTPPVPPPGALPAAETVKMPAPPPAPKPRRPSWLPLALGCGVLGIFLACAAIAAGAVATGAVPWPFGTASVPPSATLPLAGDQATAVPAATAATPEATPDPAGAEVPITPEAVEPAATPLSVERFAQGGASLAGLVASLNAAELRLVQAAAADAPAADLVPGLQEVAARAMQVGVLAQQLSESAALEAGANAAAPIGAANYSAVARLGFALVLEAHALRDDLARGTRSTSEAMHVIADYGLRLWQPGFDVPPPADLPNPEVPLDGPAGRVAHSPFLAFTRQPVDAPPVQYLRPEAVDELLALGAEQQAELQGWLVVSSETITRTLAVPATGPAPADPFAAKVVDPLLEPAGHASPEGALAARHVAQAYLTLLSGGLALPPAAPAGALLRPVPVQATPAPLLVSLPSRAVTGGHTAAPGAPPALPNVPGGQVTSIFQSPITIIYGNGQVNQQGRPEVITYERQDQPGHTVRLFIDKVTASYTGSAADSGPGKGALGLLLRYEPVPGAIDPGPAAGGYTIVCQASGLPAQAFNVAGRSGTQVAAFMLDTGVDYALRCFILANVQTGGQRIDGLVVGRTETIVVNLPGAGPDADKDGVPDDKDSCPQEPEDRDKVVDFDGCAETDADNDSLPDLEDACPELAGPAPLGCPAADSDADGLEDFKDKCPQQAEDQDGVDDLDGCPETNADNDSLPDDADRCAVNPEDVDGFEDADGCPEPDNDQDQLPDQEDFCPNEAETVNRYLDDDGCPDAWPKLTLAGTLNESAADNAGNPFSFATRFNLTVDFAGGTIAGTLTSSGAARIEFTCFNVNDPSETYDTAEASYSLSYTAAANGAGHTPGGLTVVAIQPQGTVSASVSRAYTHEQCTHLNDNPISGTGPFTGSGTLTVVANDLGQAKVSVDWSTSAFASAGTWIGLGTFQ